MVFPCSACGSEVPAGARFCPTCGTAVAKHCPNCGNKTPEGAAFCPTCGFALSGEVAGSHESTISTEARKIVSVLFVDMVGFTSDTERSDPEDVRVRLTEYHNSVRADVERYGGTVEKLIGDGVFAVFGVPVAHEDDPERAVRAALRIQESVAAIREGGTDLNVRAAVTTGEAVIQLGDDGGEGIIGDVVNTASRLEGVAQPGGVIVDTRTFTAARRVISFEPAEPVFVKGKEEPIAIWRAVEARSRLGGAMEEFDATPFLGRDRELAGMVDALARSSAERSMQLVTITGEPGVGKSRLIKEFFRYVDERPELTFWRQGRCLPYGEGITFWAIGEILKAHAGILDGESAEAAVDKWRTVVGDLFPDSSDAVWIERTLGPLVGLKVGADMGGREELFAAGRAFIEAVAERDPLILVIEDLHWADPALIDFLEQLLDWVTGSPVLLVTTARPELFAGYPAWGGGKRNAVTVALSPLSDALTAELLASLLPEGFNSPRDMELLVERCSGNPLYAIEFSRLAAEGGSPEELPASIEAVVAARLDLLSDEEKRFVQVASVIGKVFWSDAVEFLSPSGARDNARVLRSLTSREMIRPIRRSSMQGQHEFTFWHVLVRDVAYGQLTKAERARLHENTAAWLEASNTQRAADAAELVLHHLEQAIELGRLDSQERPELFAKAYQFSRAAASRSRHIDAERALKQLRHAVTYATDAVERGAALVELASTAYNAGQLDEADEAANRAYVELESDGDRLGRAKASVEKGRVAWMRGDGAAAEEHSQRAVDLVEGMEPSVDVAAIYVGRASQLMLRGHLDEARELAELTVDMARKTGATREEAGALSIMGSVAQSHDPRGIEWLRQGLQINLDGGFTARALVGYNNLTSTLQWIEGPAVARKVIEEAIELAHQRGHEGAGIWSQLTLLEHLVLEGNLPAIAPICEGLLELDRARGGSQITVGAEYHLAVLAFLEDRVPDSVRRVTPIIAGAQKIGDVQALAPGFSFGSAVFFEAGEVDKGVQLAQQFHDVVGSRGVWRAGYTHWFAESLVTAGGVDLLRSIVAGVDVLGPVDRSLYLHAVACVDESDGDHAAAISKLETAVELSDQYGLVVFGARQRLSLARSLITTKREAEASRLLEQARQAADGVGANLCVRKIDELSQDIY